MLILLHVAEANREIPKGSQSQPRHPEGYVADANQDIPKATQPKPAEKSRRLRSQSQRMDVRKKRAPPSPRIFSKNYSLDAKRFFGDPGRPKKARSALTTNFSQKISSRSKTLFWGTFVCLSFRKIIVSGRMGPQFHSPGGE